MSRPSLKDQIADVVATGNINGPLIDLGRTPAIYRMLGFPDAPLRMTRRVVLKIASGKQGHRPPISPEIIARLPMLLDEAFMVMESLTEVGTFCAGISARDNAKNLIVVALEPNGRDANLCINLCNTAFGKERPEWFAEQIASAQLVYLDKEKGHGIPEVSSLPLLQQTEPGSHDPRKTRILGAEDLRNFRKQSSAKALSSGTSA